MDIFGIFKNHVMSWFDISSWNRTKKLLKPFLDGPRVGSNKNNQFETSKVFADTRHKFENFIISIFWFSHFCLIWEVCLMPANTFDVSNRLFLFDPTLGLSKKGFRSCIALFQLYISNRDSTWFLKIPKISIFFAQNSKEGQKTGLFWPLLCYFEAVHVADI